MNNLNLVEKLKYCPEGTKLYSLVHGDVYLNRVTLDEGCYYPIRIFRKDSHGNNVSSLLVSADGRLNTDFDGECILFPSRNQRDWDKFKSPSKPKFDYSKLKPFDQVIVRNNDHDKWRVAHYSYMDYHPDTNHRIMMCDVHWEQGIPYNDETMHLVGTSKEPDEKYIWWNINN